VPNRFLEILKFLSILVAVVVLAVSLFVGFDTGNKSMKDLRKRADISQVVTALNLYYENSNKVDGEKKYPLASCSGVINEVDYEFTLKQFLAGQRPSYDNHPYILMADFPLDPWGNYSKNFNDKKTNLKACTEEYLNTETGLIYPDSSLSCDFDFKQKQYRNCYLYTSSLSGDSFQIAYYSNIKEGFVVFTKYRKNPVQESLEKL
jgi:hypothetical protein